MPTAFSLALTAVVPGAAHLKLRQYLRASALLFFYVLFIDLYIYARWVVTDAEAGALLGAWALLGAAAVWLIGMGHMVYLCFFFDKEAHRRRVEELFLQGQQQYLRGEHRTALDSFRQGVRLAPEDPDMRFYLALAYKALGELRRARRTLRQCRNLDDADRKWHWEIEQLRQEMTKAGVGGQGR